MRTVTCSLLLKPELYKKVWKLCTSMHKFFVVFFCKKKKKITLEIAILNLHILKLKEVCCLQPKASQEMP